MKDLQIIEGGDSQRKKVNIIKDKCMYLYKHGRPFRLRKSGSTYKLSSDYWNDRAYRKGFTVEDLSFIRKVKKYKHLSR